MNISILLFILLFGSIATYFSGNKWAKFTALLVSVFSLVATGLLVNNFLNAKSIDFVFVWIQNPSFYLATKSDGISIAMLLLNGILSTLIIYSSFDKEIQNAKSFYALIILMVFAMAGTFMAADALMYYIFWEMALIPIYFIALIWGNGEIKDRKNTIIKFFIYTLAGSLFMLAAFMYLYFKAGSLLIGDLYMIRLSENEQIWIFAALFLAYAIKIPIIPFHTWQANTYQKAPAVGTMLLSGIMLKMGLFSIIRWQLPITPIACRLFSDIVIGLSIAGVVYGSIIALKQKNIKKLLAYSSLAHVGLIAAGIYTISFDGLHGAVLQMLAHGIVVVGLFFAVEVIERRYNTQQISEMGGIRIQNNQFASFFMIIMLASVAMPLTFNFVGEFTLLYSLFNVNIWYAIIAGTTIILGAVYMLKMFQHVMLGNKNDSEFSVLTKNEITVFIIIVSLLLFFGIHTQPITDLVSPAIKEILLVVNKM